LTDDSIRARTFEESFRVQRIHCLVALVAALSIVETAQADTPRVHFDMPFTIACRDVTPPQFAAANPSHKLVEARFEISTLLLAGKERDLSQLFIRIDSPEQTLSVFDYLPKTLHESRYAKPIGITKTDEKNASIGINFSGKYEIFTSAGANAGLGQKSTSCVKYDLLPPLETVASSGTLLRGSGVFFKLKGNERRLLEGATQFALVLRVPHDWQVDRVRVHCEASAVERGFVSSLDQTIRVGQREFLAALYLEGDEAARQMAEESARQAAIPKKPADPRTSAKPSLNPAAWLPKHF
jgi:hypothetical protein